MMLLTKASKDILNVCNTHLPEYMIPESIEFRKDLPRTERGKVDYRALEKEANNTGESLHE